MNELIPIREFTHKGVTVDTVDARELYVFLEVHRDFSTWIKDRIEQFGFQDGVDYVSLPETVEPAQPHFQRRIEYHLTIDMAKELAMVERTPQGREARQYFIECERRLFEGPYLPQNYIEALEALLVSKKTALTLETENKELKPKAEFYDAVADANNCHSISEVAKVLGTGQNRFFVWLRDNHIFMGRIPYQRYLDAGYFHVVERTYYVHDAPKLSQTAMVTGKGMQWLQKRFHAMPAA